MTIATRLRVLCANFRIEPVPEDEAAGRGWDDRRDQTIALVKALNPAVITAQECSANIRADLLEGLGGGDTWGYWRNGNVSVWGRKAEVERIPGDYAYMLPSPPDTDPRRLVVVGLRVRNTGDVLWVASSHFTVGDPYWQNQQMRGVLDILDQHNIRNTIFGADINSSMTAGECPRTIARAGGLSDLRDALGPGRMSNETANTWNGWQPTIKASEWIDDVFCGRNVQPYYATIAETNGASDHNWIRMSAVQLAAET